MSLLLNEGQIDDLITLCGSSPTMWKNQEELICCPVHGESNPSMGISSEKQVCHCFACGFAGDFAKLLVYSLPEEFGFDKDKDKTYYRAVNKARKFIADRYELEYHEVKGGRFLNINRYGQTTNKYLKEDERVVLPRYKLAPFMSGKETYAYFFQRGFTNDDMKSFMIGRDLDSMTITIPVFYEDNTLAGVIGRYIDKNRKKNQRYKIYSGFDRSKVLFPLNKVNLKSRRVILVEGQLDAIRMYHYGFDNTLALMTDQLSPTQEKWLCEHCAEVIYIGDNDTRGQLARDKIVSTLKRKIEVKIVDYPKHGKDPCDWSKEEIAYMVKHAHGTLQRRIKRLT